MYFRIPKLREVMVKIVTASLRDSEALRAPNGNP
jgi:hypothetical protein